MKFLSRSLKLQRLMWCAVGVVFFVTCALDKAQAAPALEEDDATDGGCYYMFNHYGEGDRIMTNEPCLNCTCHNSMLMCYLRVCPFTKPIGQDCIVEKRPDQCCPVITCPEVPVSLVTQGQLISSTSTTTVGSVSSVSTAVALADRGCEMDGTFYPNGAQVISDPTKPCELCYCIRNRTACVMQECILHVEGCEPVFEPGVCCPVRYQCDIPPKIETTTTIAGLISTTLTSIFVTSTQQPGGCYRDGEFYADGSQIQTPGEAPCEHCYCMRGEIVCAVQECGSPMEGEGENCTAIPPRAGLCCPEKYQCQGVEVDTTTLEPFTSTVAVTEEKVDVDLSSTIRPTGEAQVDRVTTEAQELKPDEVATTPSQLGSTLAPEGVTSVVTEAEPAEQFDDHQTTQGPTASDRVKEVEGVTSLPTSTEVVPEASTIHVGLSTTLSASSSTEAGAATTTEREVTEGTTSAADIEKEPVTTEKSSSTPAPVDVAVTTQEEVVTTGRTTEATSVDETTVRVEEPQQMDEVPQATSPVPVESTTREEVIGHTTEVSATDRVSTDKQQVEVATATPAPEGGIQSTTQEAVPTSEQPLADDKLGQAETERPEQDVTATTVVVDDVVTQTTPKYSSTEGPVTEAVTSQEGLSSTERTTTSASQDATYQPTEVGGISTVSAAQEPSTTAPEVEGVTQQESETEKSSSPVSLVTEAPTTQKEVTESVTGAPTTVGAVEGQTQKVDVTEAVATTSEAPVRDDQQEPTTSVSVEPSTVQAPIDQTTQRETTEELVSGTSSPTTAAPAEVQEGLTASTESAGVPTIPTSEGPAGIQTSTETSTDSLVVGSTTPETQYADEGPTQKVDTESLVTGAAATTSTPQQSTIPAEIIPETTTAKLSESSTAPAFEDETKTTTGKAVESDTQRPSTVFAIVTESVTTATTLKEGVEEEQPVTTQGAIQSTTVSSSQVSTETEAQATDVTELAPTSTVSSIELVSSTESETKTTQAEILSDDTATSTTSAAEEPIGQTTSSSVEDKLSTEAAPTSTAPPSIVTEKEASTSADVLGDTTTVVSVTQASSTESSLADEPEQPSTESISASTEKVEQGSTEVADTTQEQLATSTESGSTVSAIATESATATTVIGEVTESTAASLPPSSPVNLLSSPTTPSSVTEFSTIGASTEGEAEGGTTSKVMVQQDETVTEILAPSTSRPTEEIQGTSTVAQTEFTTAVTEIVRPTEPTAGATDRPQDLLATSTEKVSVTTSVSVEEGSTTSAAGTELPQTSTVESIGTSSSTEATQAPLFDQDQPSEAPTTERVEAEAGSTEVPSEPKSTTFSTATESATQVADDEAKSTSAPVTTVPDTATATSKVEVTEATTQFVEGVSTVVPEGLSSSTERVDQTTVSEVQETAQPSTSRPLGDDVVSDSTSGPVSKTTTAASTESELLSTTEQEEVASTGLPRIPGEGSCFVEGITYRNGSRIPPSSPCQIACACQNSIVHCLLVHCPPPPTRFGDCKPIYMPQTCCPKYDCDVASSSPGSIVTPVSEEEKTEEDKIIVTPEPSTSQETPEPAVDDTVQSDDTSEGPSTTEAFGSSSTEKSTESTSTEVKIDSTSEEAPTSPLLPQTVEPVEGTPSPTVPTEVTEGTTTRPVAQTEPVEGADVSTTPHPIVEAVSTTMATEFDNETSTTPLYPVTVSTTVTSSPAAWPYPSQTTTPAGMSTGACLFDSRVYMSAQQILRDDPCDFCFCFRGDIICLQQSCPPPIPGCYEEPIPGFCCPRYECPVGNSTTGSQGLLPPSYYHNQVLNNLQPSSAPSIVSGSGPGCEVQGEYYEAGQKIKSASGPCLECRCGENGMMNCDPRECQPEPMLRKMIEAISS